MNKQSSDDILSNHIHHKVAVRELLAWLIGAIIGLYPGALVGLLVGNNFAPVLGCAIGWCLGGYICWRISRTLFRSEPKYRISARSAKDACFGLVIGSLAGGYISEAAQTSKLVGIVVGMIAGLVIGASIGESSTRSALKKEAKAGSGENGV